eukprot:2865936-Rhodomonas_salina.1
MLPHSKKIQWHGVRHWMMLTVSAEGHGWFRLRKRGRRDAEKKVTKSCSLPDFGSRNVVKRREKREERKLCLGGIERREEQRRGAPILLLRADALLKIRYWSREEREIVEDLHRFCTVINVSKGHDVSPARSDTESVSKKTRSKAQPEAMLNGKESPLAGAKNAGGCSNRQQSAPGTPSSRVGGYQLLCRTIAILAQGSPPHTPTQNYPFLDLA